MAIELNTPVIGVDLGGTNMQVAVVEFQDSGHVIHGRHWCETGASAGAEAVMDRMVEGVEAACTEAGVGRERIAAVGIAAAGAVDINTGTVLDAPNLEWEDVPLRDSMAQRLNMRVIVDNDVNAAVWAEHQLGAGRGHAELLGVWVGTGVGGGLVIGNRLYHGPNFTAGEIGHTILLPDERPGCRTVEDLSSRSGMSRLIDRKLHQFPKSLLHERSEVDDELEPITMRMLVEALEQDDALVKRTVHRGAKMLGVAIANWVTALSLECVVLGGGVVEAFGRPYLARIGASFNTSVFPDRLKQCKLVMTELAGDAGTLGAGLLAAERGASSD